MFPDEISDAERLRIRTLEAVEGYATLEMWDFAWEEISQLSPDDLLRPEVQEMTLALLMRQSRWKEAILVGRTLCRECPDLPQAFLHTAFCLHENGETPEALKTLRSGPNALQQDALYHYNTACYLAVMGYENEAREALRTAFALDDNLRENARNDKDLQSLWRH